MLKLLFRMLTQKNVKKYIFSTTFFSMIFRTFFQKILYEQFFFVLKLSETYAQISISNSDKKNMKKNIFSTKKISNFFQKFFSKYFSLSKNCLKRMLKKCLSALFDVEGGGGLHIFIQYRGRCGIEKNKYNTTTPPKKI